MASVSVQPISVAPIPRRNYRSSLIMLISLVALLLSLVAVGMWSSTRPSLAQQALREEGRETELILLRKKILQERRTLSALQQEREQVTAELARRKIQLAGYPTISSDGHRYYRVRTFFSNGLRLEQVEYPGAWAELSWTP